MPFTVNEDALRAFVQESNRIEGIIRAPLERELRAHREFLASEVSLAALEELVSQLQPDAKLRARPGMNVRVGNHYPMPGGPDVVIELEALVQDVIGSIEGEDRNIIHACHIQYETIHPFMDGNGRSGRALWLWHHLHHHQGDPYALNRGFLHTWYYESLSYARSSRP